MNRSFIRPMKWAQTTFSVTNTATTAYQFVLATSGTGPMFIQATFYSDNSTSDDDFYTYLALYRGTRMLLRDYQCTTDAGSARIGNCITYSLWVADDADQPGDTSGSLGTLGTGTTKYTTTQATAGPADANNPISFRCRCTKTGTHALKIRILRPNSVSVTQDAWEAV